MSVPHEHEGETRSPHLHVPTTTTTSLPGPLSALSGISPLSALSGTTVLSGASSLPTPTSPTCESQHDTTPSPSRPASFAYPELAAFPGIEAVGGTNMRGEEDVYRNLELGAEGQWDAEREREREQGRTTRLHYALDESEHEREREREDRSDTLHTLVGGHTPHTFTAHTLSGSPMTLKGADAPQPPTMHLSPRGTGLRRRTTIASTITLSSASSVSSSSSGGWGPIAGLANLVERAIARWARHADSESEASSSRSSLISYPTYRAPPRTSRLFSLLLPEARAQEGERFLRTEDLPGVLGLLEPELQRRFRHRRHRRAPAAGEGKEGGEERRRRKRGKSRLREDEGSGGSTPDPVLPPAAAASLAAGGKGKLPASSPPTPTLPGSGSCTSTPNTSTPNPNAQNYYATPAALLRADLGSRAGSGVNLSLLSSLHQSLAMRRELGQGQGSGSPVLAQGFGAAMAGGAHGLAGGAHPPAAVHGGHTAHQQGLPLPPSAPSAAPPLPLPGKERSAWWLDVASPTPSDMRALGKLLHLHPLTLEDILFQDPREKLDLYPRLGYYFVSFSAVPSREEAPGMPYSKTLDPDAFSVMSDAEGSEEAGKWDAVDLGDLGPSKIEGVQMYMVVFADGIVTFHFHDFEQHLTAVRERALRLERMFPILAGSVLRCGADWIAHGLVDSIVDAYLPIIKRLERETDRLASMIQSFTFHKGQPKFNAPGAGARKPPEPGTDPASAAAFVAKQEEDVFADGFGDTGREGVLGVRAFDAGGDKPVHAWRVGVRSSGSGEREEEIEMEEKTNGVIDRQIERKVEREQELEKEAERAYTHRDGPLRPPRRRLTFFRDAYGALVKLVPHRGLQRVMSIEPTRPKPPHPRVVTLYRIASARRMVTSISRLLVHKQPVLSSLRRRFSGVKGIKGDVGVYLDDVEDHVIGMQQALAYCDGTLSQLHPGYLSQLKVAFENAKNGMDWRLLLLSLISITILTIQVWIGLFSMNVHVPNSKTTHTYEWFGFIFVGMLCLLCFVFGLVRFWWVKSKRKFKERARNR
ncbi:hypothetical protein CALVIDRAFT_528025 [Calocera viscosa TUFC12733]|uniref:Cora-domain-containing protein n=1 Tax=Calocera viscosa (strain TUFC12733) TaxID=1330018 RepID=A0A167LDC4_CALVF|nr:hypothetical protein CALVIDRAFT_528025 [Calocera viscosa TUFC12733]